MSPARRRHEPPPVADDNPPSPPTRQPPPEPESTVETVVAQHEPGLLASMLAGNATSGEAPMADTARVISGLVNLRRKHLDPMTDYVADGTRKPRFIKEAITHEAALTGRSCQEIERDALLGIRPLSTELLDAHYADLYGEERGQETR